MTRPLVLLSVLAFGSAGTFANPAQIPPEAVVVLYNSAAKESKELARYYAKARNIPEDRLVGLDLPQTDSISRTDFDAKIRDPLLKHFDDKGWWKREMVANHVQPVANTVRVVVTLRGVPFKIERTPDTIPPEARARQTYIPSTEGNEASVDSELSLLGVSGYPIKGSIPNPYFNKDESVMTIKSTSFLVVGRIDAPTYPICHRMIDDALATEKNGLWGMAYIDLAKKGPGYEVGDTWIENIARSNNIVGIPTVVDRNRDTFVTNYPMRDAAVYFGWYAHQRNGPLLNPAFRFKRGAVAVHLHSFSAYELRNKRRRWAGPILDHGAAATLGNVYEPFLQLTHQLDLFYERLLKSYTIGEAACMAIRTLSWQAVLLGDPLYRPFPILTPESLKIDGDREYKALRAGFITWSNDREELIKQLRTTAAELNSGILYEALGLNVREAGQREEAAAFFEAARQNYEEDADKLRQILHLADLDRQSARENTAIQRLRGAKTQFGSIPESQAVTALLNILDPPAPPPARVDR